jgi:PTH1 family peptidyl-tRNA hydrolase
MKLVIGLGNPGKKYDGTRHNVGFCVLQLLQSRWKLGAPQTKFQSLLSESNQPNEKVLLVWPQTFMNVSGTSALLVRDFYKVANSDILVICDDFALPLGKLRIRPLGSGGGQKGLADILRRLGTEEIPRLRLGVGPLPDGRNAADFVLGRFGADERTTIEIAIERAADAVEDWINGNNLVSTMNKFNADPP